jgi:hypothetical protein
MLPSRNQNITSPARTKTAVGIRGSSRISDIILILSDKPNILSQYLMSLLRTLYSFSFLSRFHSASDNSSRIWVRFW